jgi:hypothetical protein
LTEKIKTILRECPCFVIFLSRYDKWLYYVLTIDWNLCRVKLSCPKIRRDIEKGKKMKKIILILSFLVFASPAWAIIYKWTDQRGTINFTDTYDNVPPAYRNSAQKIDIPQKQTLIPEGDFAIKLAEALKLGKAENEAEAESILASAGITPKNGWIADYPVTPDIIGQLQNSVEVAADSGKLSMNKGEALKALENLTAPEGLPVTADTESQVAEAEPPPNEGEYANLNIINNYYFDQGSPVVTYYPYNAGGRAYVRSFTSSMGERSSGGFHAGGGSVGRGFLGRGSRGRR